MKILSVIVLVLLGMSLLGCFRKKTPPKTDPWPRFPASDNPNMAIVQLIFPDSFGVQTFFISPDRQHVFVLCSRISPRQKRAAHPSIPTKMDYLLASLDANGQPVAQKTWLNTDMNGRGLFFEVQDEFMLYLGNFLLVLNPQTLDILEKIPVHSPLYIAWKETERTHDEQQADYKKALEAVLQKENVYFLECWAGGQYFIFEQGVAGKRAAWMDINYEPESRTALKAQLPLMAANHNRPMPGDTLCKITDEAAYLHEIELLSGGTQFSYPNYKTRSIVQYEMMANAQKIRFSTTDKDNHALKVGVSDNGLLTSAGGTAWLKYEDMLFRVRGHQSK